MATGAARAAAACAFCLGAFLARVACAQVDTAEQKLLEFGYDHPGSGGGPTAGYGFLYLNRPDFLRKGSTLRLAAAPVYIDGEYGIGRALGPRTDLGLGLAGGGFAQKSESVVEKLKTFPPTRAIRRSESRLPTTASAAAKRTLPGGAGWPRACSAPRP